MKRKIEELFKKFRRDHRGITLTETIMASSLFSFLFLALFTTLSSSGNLLRMQVLHSSINQSGMQLLRSIHREIAESSPVADESHLTLTRDANNNSIVTFQVPVDWDNDGDVVQDNLTQVVEWGAYRFVREPQQQSWLNGWVRYRVLNEQLLREILTSPTGVPVITDVLVPADVQAFQVTLSGRRVSVLLTVNRTDTVLERGTNARTYQTTFNGNVFVRNGG